MKRSLTDAEVQDRVDEIQTEEWDDRWDALREEFIETELDDLITTRLEAVQEREADVLAERVIEQAEERN